MLEKRMGKQMFSAVNLLIFKEKIYLCYKQKGNDHAVYRQHKYLSQFNIFYRRMFGGAG